MAYATTHEVWKHLGDDAYTKVRDETLGTGNGTTTVFDFDEDNLISGSVTIYTDGSIVTSSEYTLNLDDGKVTFSSAPTSGIVVTADYDYSDVPDSWVSSVLDQADDELESLTGRYFGHTSGTEYISVEEGDLKGGDVIFWLKNYPVTHINYVSCNTASSVTDTPQWSASTGGLGNDYLTNSDDLSLGRIRWIDNFPLAGQDRIKINYSYGYATTPPLVKELSILLAIRKLINSAVYKSIIKGRDGFTPVRLDEIDNRINSLLRIYRKQNINAI